MPLLQLLGLLQVPLLHLLLHVATVVPLLRLLTLSFLFLLELQVLLVLLVDQLLLLLQILRIQLGIAGVGWRDLVRLEFAGARRRPFVRNRLLARVAVVGSRLARIATRHVGRDMIRRSCFSCGNNTLAAELSGPGRRSDRWLFPDSAKRALPDSPAQLECAAVVRQRAACAVAAGPFLPAVSAVL